MNRVSTENFFKQARQAAVDQMVYFAAYHMYEKEFPEKITIVQDCIDFKDVNHFNNWLKNRPE